MDTTSYIYDLSCNVIGIEHIDQNPFWKMFPNPASESITIAFTNDRKQKQLEVYNVVGRLIKTIEATEAVKLDVSDLPNGLYFIRIKDNKQPALKFVKH